MFVLEDVQPGTMIKKAKKKIPFQEFKEQAEELIKTLKESGLEVQPAGSYGVLKELGEEPEAGYNNLDLIVNDVEKSYRILKGMGGEDATKEELGVLLVRDLEEGKLYTTTPFPTSRFIRMPKGLVVTLIPRENLVMFHSKIGDPLIARKVRTPNTGIALLYKLVRGRKSDINLLSELAKVGKLSSILEDGKHVISPYLSIDEVRKRVDRIIRKIETHNPEEARKLRKFLDTIPSGRYFEAYRHPIPTKKNSRPNLPGNEKIILSKKELKKYLAPLEEEL